MREDAVIFHREYVKWLLSCPAYISRLRLEDIFDYALNDHRSETLPDWVARQIDIDRVELEKQRSRMQRKTSEYAEWRMNVFNRDGFTCQLCGQVGGKLNAHHIKPYAKYPELRLDVNNGITLCERCHRALHKKIRESARERHEE